jgi:hypothetical protein
MFAPTHSPLNDPFQRGLPPLRPLPKLPPKDEPKTSRLESFVRIGQEQLERFDLPEFTDADKLKLGFYPGKDHFQHVVSKTLFETLPGEVGGWIFPYMNGKTVTMVVINDTDASGELAKKRYHVFGKGKHYFNQEGIFGLSRLRGKKPRVIVTDDEMLVCRDERAVAIQKVSADTIAALRRCTNNISLVSKNQKWIKHMLLLASHDFVVSLDGENVLEHVTKATLKVLSRKIDPAVMSREIKHLLAPLSALQQTAVVQAVKAHAHVDLSAVLREGINAYTSEAAFYKALDDGLATRVRAVRLVDEGLAVTFDNFTKTIPQTTAALTALVCWAFDTGPDLVAWAQTVTKEIPKPFADQHGGTRLALNAALAEVVITALYRRAMEES